MKKILITGTLALVALLFIPAKLMAADLRSSNNGEISVGSSERVKNLYIAGNSVKVGSPVASDLVAAGNNLTIDGNVEDDLFAAGANLYLNGNVGKNVRAAGANINVNGNIGEDLLLAGSVIEVSDKTSVVGDMLVAGNKVDISGHIGGLLRAVGEEIVIDGTVTGDVIIPGANKVTIKSSAVIGGKLKYSSPNEATIESGSKIGSVDYTKTEGYKSSARNFQIEGLIFKLISSLIMMLILIYVFPRFTKKVTDNAYASYLANAGYGLLALIVTPIIALVLLLLVITSGLSVILGLLYILYIIIASALVGILLGSISSKFIKKTEDYPIDWQTAVIGAFLVLVLSLIKFVGPLVIFIFFITALGSLVSLTVKNIAENRK